MVDDEAEDAEEGDGLGAVSGTVMGLGSAGSAGAAGGLLMCCAGVGELLGRVVGTCMLEPLRGEEVPVMVGLLGAGVGLLGVAIAWGVLGWTAGAV